MKIIKQTFLIALLALSSIFTSCEDDNASVVIVVSEERAAEVVATSLAYNTYGMASSVYYISNAINTQLNCDETGTDNSTINYTSLFGGVTAVHQYNDSYSKTCSPNPIINFETEAQQSVDAVYFSSNHNVNGDFVVTGLEDTALNELYSGMYHRVGDWYSKIYHDSMDIDYTMAFNELVVDKATYYITGGTSEFTLITKYSESTESYTFKGTVTFLNQDEAQIDFEDGDSYLLNLERGTITKI